MSNSEPGHKIDSHNGAKKKNNITMLESVKDFDTKNRDFSFFFYAGLKS